MDDLPSAKAFIHILSWIYGERNGKVKLSKQNSLIDTPTKVLSFVDKDRLCNPSACHIAATLVVISCEPCVMSISVHGNPQQKKKRRKSYFDSTSD